MTTNDQTSPVSTLWRSLSKDLFSRIDETFLRTFRQPGGANSRLAAWDPRDGTYRYFLATLFNATRAQPDRFFDLYERLEHTDLGNPLAVEHHGLRVNLDYFLAVDEFLFLESRLGEQTVNEIHKVVEVGAGFGRTCHTFLSLFPNVQEYVIVDLPEMLQLSRAFLAATVPAFVNRVRFVNALREEDWRGQKPDLALNIDSFQEMPRHAIDAYYAALFGTARWVYVKNPVCKYDPARLGIGASENVERTGVFELGYMTEMADIFSDAALRTPRSLYVERYRPGGFTTVADMPSSIFPQYHHALYQSSLPSARPISEL